MLPPADHKPPPHEPDPKVEMLARLRKQLLGKTSDEGADQSVSRSIDLIRSRRMRQRHSRHGGHQVINEQLDALRKQLLLDRCVRSTSA